VLIVQVYVQVKPECADAFMRATAENAAASLKEKGVARFDVMRMAEDPCRFLLTEAYRDEKAPGEHKQTAHYKKWREAVEPMMANPRRSEKYAGVFPADGQWG
jgi:quinol monooxygenase YgiN